MPITYSNPGALDAQLDWYRTNVTTMHFLTGAVATYAEIAGAEIGAQAVVVGASADGADGARYADIPAFTGATVDTPDAENADRHIAFSNGTDTLVRCITAAEARAFTVADTWGIAAPYRFTATPPVEV